MGDGVSAEDRRAPDGDSESLFSLIGLRGRDEGLADGRVFMTVAERDALVDVVEAAQAVDDNTLVCPAGHLDALELALSKFEEAE